MVTAEDDITDPASRMVATENSDSDGQDFQNQRCIPVLILFYAMGMLSLVPGNFFTTANSYWMYKFRNTSDPDNENRTSLQSQFVSAFSIVSQVSTIVFVVLTAILSKKLALTARLFSPIICIIIVFIVTIIFAEVDTDSWQAPFFGVTLFTGILLTGACGAFIVSIFEMAAKFPPEYLATILSGQAICGIFAALVQIFAISIGASAQTTGLTYFLVGLFFVVLTNTFLFYNMQKSDYFKYFYYKPLTAGRLSMNKELVLGVLKKISLTLVSMVIVFGSAIMIFPGVASLVVSVNKGNGNKWNDLYFVPVATFLFYNFFDYVGRELSLKVKRPTSPIAIFVMSLLRIVFMPLIMFCKTEPRHHLEVLFNADYPYIIFIILFGFTHGYLVNLCIITIIRISSPEERIISNILIMIFMMVGLGICSFAASALVKAL